MRSIILLFAVFQIFLSPLLTFAQEDVLYGVTMLGELYSIDPDSTDTYIGQKERVQLLGKYLPVHSLAYVNGYFYATFGTNADRMVRFGFSGGDEVELEDFQNLGFENAFSLERKDSTSVYIGFAVSPSDNRESDEVGVLDLDTMSTTISTPLDTPHSDCIQGIAYDDSLVTLDWGCELGTGNVFVNGDTYILDNRV